MLDILPRLGADAVIKLGQPADALAATPLPGPGRFAAPGGQAHR
jgi:hypothetical protein